MDDPRLDYADGTERFSDPEADYYSRPEDHVYAYLQQRGDNEGDPWEMVDDFRTFDNFYDGMAALWKYAAADLRENWAPERRLVVHYESTNRTKYFKATYIEVFDD